jgi:hypothetical protein
MAASNGDAILTLLLLERGADVNGADEVLPCDAI